MIIYETSEIFRERTPLETKLEKHCEDLGQRLKAAEARVRELEGRPKKRSKR